MILLVASILALFAGPACIVLLGRRPGAVVTIDAFVLVAIGGLVFFHILPHSISAGGWPALVAAVVGLLAPAALHGPLDECGDGRGTGPLLSLAVLAIGLHAFFDGVALVGGHSLALAVVLHRVLEGLGIWWLVRPHHGPRGTAWVVSTIAGATLLGYLGGDAALHTGLGTVVNIIQAMVAGSLLHVLLRHAPPPGDMGADVKRVTSSVGGLLALAMLWLLQLGPEPGHHHSASVEVHAGSACLEMALAAAPALLAAYSIIAVMHAALPGTLLPRGGGKRWRDAAQGALVGLLATECSCGVLPLYRAAVRDRVPRAAAVAFLLAAPSLGAAALLLSFTWVGGMLTAWRAGVLALAAWCAGIFFGRGGRTAVGSVSLAGVPDGSVRWQGIEPTQSLIPRSAKAAMTPVTQAVSGAADIALSSCEPLGASGASLSTHDHATDSARRRLADGMHFALGEVLDRSAPWVLFGLALATFIRTAVPTGWLSTLQQSGWEIPLFALVGAPFYLTASAATMIAGALLSQGSSPGAALAFLLTASATSLSTASFLQDREPDVARAVTLLVLGTALAAGYCVNATGLPAAAPFVLGEYLAPSAASMLRVGALMLLVALFVVSLVRQGVRPFLGQVAIPNAMGPHSHHHDHDHDE